MSTPFLRHRRQRQRGALLVEAALAVGIAASLITLTFAITEEQQARSDFQLVAAEKRGVMLAARTYVREKNEEILEALFAASLSGGGDGVLTITMQDLIDSGFLVSSLNPGAVIEDLYGQEYVLLARAVFQSDSGSPAVTLRNSDMDPFGNGAIDPRYLDGDLSNLEVAIESVLFTTGGDPMPLGRMGRAVEWTQLLNAGAIIRQNTSSGALGSMSFNLTGYSIFSEYTGTGPGRFASPISLGSLGVLGDLDSGGPGSSEQLREAFLRCFGIDSALPQYDDCINDDGNKVYADMVLQPYDLSGDGNIDTYPSITGATRLVCINPLEDPLDPVDPDVFLIDCSTTRLSGDLVIDGTSVSFAGETLVEERTIAGSPETVVTADRLTLQIPDGVGGFTERDMAEVVFDTQVVPARGVIPVPQCHGTSLDGTPMEPRAIAHVASFADPWGRPVSGARANVERGYRSVAGDPSSWVNDDTGNQWMVRLRYVISDNFCASSWDNPVPISSLLSIAPNVFVPGTRQPDLARCSAGDAGADIYELYPNGSLIYGAASVSIRCF